MASAGRGPGPHPPSPPLKDQLARIRLTLFLSVSIGLLGILAAYVLSRAMGVPPSWLTRDLADITQRGSYLGLLSQLGIMAWTAAAAICFWSAWMLRPVRSLRTAAGYLLSSGSLTAVLLLDDAFMLHERMFPKAGVPEVVVFMAYAAVAIGWAVYFFRHILRTEYLLLFSACFFLGVSALLDQAFPFSETMAFMEDSPKFIGIILWLVYFGRTGSAEMRSGYECRV